MKKIALFVVILLAAVPAMAVVTVTATQSGPTEVDITATHSGENTMPRAYALDITVDSGQTIDSISSFFSGECSSASQGYGIFPANFNRFIDADDPCWGEPNYTPVADACDLPGDTQGGLGTAGITVEMGSLYKGANSPPSPATLCTVSVSGSCYLGFALNVGRGKIVLEDGNEPSSVVLNGTAVVVCTVPDVLDMNGTDANDAIDAAGFVSSVIAECNDTEAAGEVLAQSPSAGATPGCGATVTITVSTGPCVVANCWDASECVAQMSGDATCDGSVNLNDLDALKTAWGKSSPWTAPDCCADFTHDGQVNLNDLDALKAGWGLTGQTPSTNNQTCPP